MTVRRFRILLWVGFAIFMAVYVAIRRPPSATRPDAELFLFCGAGLRPAVAELVAEFENVTDIRLRVDYNASSLLLGKIRVGGEGDLFMPGDDHYVRLAEADGLIQDSRTVAAFVPAIMVGAGNPKNVQSIADFARSDLRIGFADERTAAIGRIAHAILEKAGLSRNRYEPAIVFQSVTVHELGTAIELGHIDAAIVWEPVAQGFERSETVAIPEPDNIVAPVPVAILSGARREADARRFLEFALSEPGQAVFRRHGYGPPPGED